MNKKYKATLVTNYWTEIPKEKAKIFRNAGFKVKVFNVFNGMTNLELLIDLSSDNVTEFMAKLESSVVILKKYGLEVWSIVNTERVILTEEIDVNKLKFADSKLIESILTEK